MIGHMMDPGFVGQGTGHAVESITFALTMTNEQVIDGGGHEVTCWADITVLWGPNIGASCAVRLIFKLFPDEDGFYRIREIRELPAFLRDASVEQSSWGLVKALYR